MTVLFTGLEIRALYHGWTIIKKLFGQNEQRCMQHKVEGSDEGQRRTTAFLSEPYVGRHLVLQIQAKVSLQSKVNNASSS